MFDTIPNQRLMRKLASYGIIRNVYNWVRVGKDWSTKADVLSGIQQGSVLGPILFRIFVNDLLECVQSCCKLSAVNTKIYDSACNCTKILEDIYRLQEWSDMWNLYFNVTKCMAMRIGRKNEEADYKMKVNEDEYRSIAKCNEEKDLSIIFDKSFSFDVHIQSCINKANKMIGIMKRSFTFFFFFRERHFQ